LKEALQGLEQENEKHSTSFQEIEELALQNSCLQDHVHSLQDHVHSLQEELNILRLHSEHEKESFLKQLEVTSTEKDHYLAQIEKMKELMNSSQLQIHQEKEILLNEMKNVTEERDQLTEKVKLLDDEIVSLQTKWQEENKDSSDSYEQKLESQR
jgi:predicted nuclease with TOPRIM domain